MVLFVYCTGTQYENQFPCPRGSYRPNTNGVDLEDCTVCDPGKYCQFEGNTTVTDDCDPGKIGYQTVISHPSWVYVHSF